MTLVGYATKKPVEIKFCRFYDTPEVLSELEDFMRRKVVVDNNDANKPELLIDTLDGTMRASAGDYIIRGVQGEFYPCKPAIFEATYDITNALKEINTRGNN